MIKNFTSKLSKAICRMAVYKNIQNKVFSRFLKAICLSLLFSLSAVDGAVSSQLYRTEYNKEIKEDENKHAEEKQSKERPPNERSEDTVSTDQDSSTVKKIEKIKDELSKVNQIRATIFNNIKNSFYTSFKSFYILDDYYSHIKSNTSYLFTNKETTSIVYYSIFFSMITLFITFFSSSWITRVSIAKRVTNPILLAVYKQIISTFLFIFTLTFSNLNSVFARIPISIFIGLSSFNLVKACLQSFIDRFSTARRMRRNYNKDLLGVTTSYIKKLIILITLNYTLYYWTALVVIQDIDFRALMQINLIITSLLITTYMWKVKKLFEKYILSSSNKNKIKEYVPAAFRFLVMDVIANWHIIFSSLIIFTTLALILPGNFLYIGANAFVTIFLIIILLIFNKLIRAVVLKYLLQTKNYQKKMFLFREFKSSYKLIRLCFNLALLQSIGYMWDVNLFFFFRNMFTPMLFDKVAIIFTAIVLSKVIIFTGDYYLLVYKTVNSENHKKVKQLIKIGRISIRLAVYIVSFLFSIQFMGYDALPFITSLSFISFGISIGAQTLIKDLFAGFFLILDHTLDIGDMVEIDSKIGMIEELTINAMKIRLQDNGALYTVQYGEIRKIANKNRNFSYTTVRVPLDYNMNVDDATKVLRDIYADIKKTEPLGKSMLAPLEVRGIRKMLGHEVVLEVRVKTATGSDIMLGRLFNLKIKNAFQKQNISLSDGKFILNSD